MPTSGANYLSKIGQNEKYSRWYVDRADLDRWIASRKERALETKSRHARGLRGAGSDANVWKGHISMPNVARIAHPNSEERDTARTIIQNSHRRCLAHGRTEVVEYLRDLILLYASVEFQGPEDPVFGLSERPSA